MYHNDNYKNVKMIIIIVYIYDNIFTETTQNLHVTIVYRNVLNTTINELI